MNADSVGEIIATRQLHLLDDANEKRTVSVFIGKPQPATDSSAYECSFQVIGIGSQEAKKRLAATIQSRLYNPLGYSLRRI